MESKPAQNIQDSFLNTARKDKSVITIYLLSGVKLTGRIRSFDKYSVVLDTNNQEQLIFKHAISTVVMSRPHVDRAPWRATGGWRRAGCTSNFYPASHHGELTYFSSWGNEIQTTTNAPGEARETVLNACFW